MKYLQLSDYTGLRDVYLSFGGDELFLAGADSIRKRLEEYGVHVTVEICEGLYHSYAMLPLVKDAQEGDQNFVAISAGKNSEGETGLSLPAIIFCAAITLLLISAVAFIYDAAADIAPLQAPGRCRGRGCRLFLLILIPLPQRQIQFLRRAAQ